MTWKWTHAAQVCQILVILAALWVGYEVVRLGREHAQQAWMPHHIEVLRKETQTLGLEIIRIEEQSKERASENRERLERISRRLLSMDDRIERALTQPRTQEVAQ